MSLHSRSKSPKPQGERRRTTLMRKSSSGHNCSKSPKHNEPQHRHRNHRLYYGSRSFLHLGDTFVFSSDFNEKVTDIINRIPRRFGFSGSKRIRSTWQQKNVVFLSVATLCVMACTFLPFIGLHSVDGFHIKTFPQRQRGMNGRRQVLILPWRRIQSSADPSLGMLSVDESDEDTFSTPSPASLRSVTFSNLQKDQEPQLLCNFLMELGACSTSITDADLGTDHESPLFDEFDTSRMTRTAVTTHVWNHCHVTAHFPASTSLEWIMDIVQDSFPNLPRYDKVTNVEDRDWVLHVQQSWKPIVLPPFVLRFPWHTDDAVDEAVQKMLYQNGNDEYTTTKGLVQLQLQGGIAFGTGEHPTTQLCLEFVSNVVQPNMLIMDYGAGSGVLGMAACKLDPTVRAVGVDIDVDAVQIGNANAKINNVNMRNYLSDLVQTSDDDESTSILLKAYSSKKDATTEILPTEWNGPIYDAVVANILAAPLISLAPTLASLLKPGAPMGLSGIMSSQSSMILDSKYKDLFDDLKVEKELGGWVLITGIRKGY
ncbi:ribosomal protein L11 methyltransferase [Nitzschia inconspicua]|uniref:Ribosomal protein L11 methyltransferase n=1 Tax=Nitzschia inconspicua TaxID=303405 RepID=A0A9K3KIC1_9STRA|nr:ribosomal protein L11 methyltransferase [Nitzschia inconspicua]